MPTHLWPNPCLAILFCCLLIGCNTETAQETPEPKTTEDPMTTEQFLEELINPDDSGENETGQSTAAAILTQPSGKADVPQHYKDAPVQRVVQNYDSGKPRVVFDAKVVGDRSLVQHGDYVEYYLNAQKVKQGRYEYGKQVGDWTYWSKTGKIRKQGRYEQGKQQGDWKKFRDDGSLEWIEKYVDGRADGQWEAYREDSKTIFWQRSYKAGERYGKWQNFYPDGKPHTLEEYAHGKLDGAAKTWDENGNLVGEGVFRQGKRHGTFRRFKDGKLYEEAQWVDDVRQSSGG